MTTNRFGRSLATGKFPLPHPVGERSTRGVVTLHGAAQQIARGDLSAPSPAKAPNLEIAELQKAFITMAANLRATRDALDRQVEEERKMREMVQSLQRQVVRQERLAAVGLLVSGVAHELNNPLQAILGTAELLERDSHLSAEALEEITLLKTQSGRAREIIRNLSRFGSQQSGTPTLVDLRTVISEVVQLRRHDLEKSSRRTLSHGWPQSMRRRHCVRRASNAWCASRSHKLLLWEEHFRKRQHTRQVSTTDS